MRFPGREAVLRAAPGWALQGSGDELRFLVRMLGYLLVAGGFVALLTDGARSIANSALRFTPLGETLLTFVGERFRQLQPAVERNLHPMLWDPVLLNVLQVPTAAAGLLLGFLLLWLGAAPKPQIGILTRR
ncbi:hypothetical protein ACQKLX_16560 [Bosea sp. NPDC003192]|uniref:hypothetical protein n=1 Tax=Bosea sp. NPDC003192 TaxID=3390551 RepID=UPI003D059252